MFENKEQFCTYLKMIGCPYTKGVEMSNLPTIIFSDDYIALSVVCWLVKDYFGYEIGTFADVSNWNYLYGTVNGRSLCGTMYSKDGKFIRISIRTYGEIFDYNAKWHSAYIEYGYRDRCIRVCRANLEGINSLLDFISNEKVDVT